GGAPRHPEALHGADGLDAVRALLDVLLLEQAHPPRAGGLRERLRLAVALALRELVEVALQLERGARRGRAGTVGRRLKRSERGVSGRRAALREAAAVLVLHRARQPAAAREHEAVGGGHGLGRLAHLLVDADVALALARVAEIG